MSADDYVGILRRRWLLLLIPALILPVVAYSVSLALPERYTSDALVLVDAPKVPQSIVPTIVTEQLNQRLGTMQQQVLSRSRLQPIIERFGLYKDDVGRVPMEDLVVRMRKAIVVSAIRSMSQSRAASNDIPGFTISFTYDNPRLAQQVCNELLAEFMSENLKLRAARAQGTTEFLAKQVEAAKRQLDERDAKLAEFKRRYFGQMPGQEQTNMQLLMNATAQLEAATATVNRTQQDRTYAQSQLDQAITAWKSSQTGANPQTLDQQLTQAQTVLDDLLAKYTPDHPDVTKQKAVVAQIKKKIDDANAASKAPVTQTTASAVEPPNIQQLRNLLHTYDVTIKEKTRDQERLQELVKTYRARIESSPLVEQQFKELTRDYEAAQGHYDEMVKKRTASELGERLENEQQSEQFRVMDSPNLPEKPSFPNRLMFAAGGFGGGIFFGLALAVLLEIKDKSLRNEQDIEAVLQLPTLAMIPTVNPVKARSKGLLSKFRKKAA
jgi:polysaccharide chain length determinant protein (PEP-CTERM system associated)